ncbi:proline racemase family protein [Ruegeria arenilitoris]|uniref:4-hydroxyproline epimerase n=1 Tax=Ruegeria arenilitoris TaxID=1173585 RepID=UPI00147C20B8|nr:proline racemase family protein [Ruegeria arenilitoris]
MHVIDSHTGGEPTRVVLTGAPDLGSGTLAERALRLAEDYQDLYRSILLEPRGQPAMVGAMLVEPVDRSCVTGVIYFDVDAVLGMCGHGTIGLAVTLAHLGRIDTGIHRIETPAGVVTVELHNENTVSVTNIESRRVRRAVNLDVPGHGCVVGDVAYGGNWFFIVDPSPIPVETSNIAAMTKLTIAIRKAAMASGLRGENSEPVDHVILQEPSPRKGVSGRNFVLCPDNNYDRSPCGTGCSACLACLAAEGELAESEEIIQESVIGSTYHLSYKLGPNGGIIPRIKGQAFIMSEANLMFDPHDPFRSGIEI